MSTLSTAASYVNLKSQWFERFTSWKSLSQAIAALIHMACCFEKDKAEELKLCEGWHGCEEVDTVAALMQAKNVIIRGVQQEMYAKEVQCIRNSKDAPRDSSLSEPHH